MTHEFIWTLEVDVSDMKQEDIDYLEEDLANIITAKLGKDKVKIMDYNPMLVEELQSYYNRNYQIRNQ